MGTQFIVSIVFTLIIEIQSQYYKNGQTQLYSKLSGYCKLDRTYLGDRKIDMRDGTEVQGMKVKFKPSCGLRDVDEYRGLKYAELNIADKHSLRFLPNRDRGRPTSDKHSRIQFATEYKSVCPQKPMEDVLKSLKGMPEKILEKMVEIGKFTGKQIEGCLWLNLFVPYIGKAKSDFMFITNTSYIIKFFPN
jgi:hypothetical protein